MNPKSKHMEHFADITLESKASRGKGEGRGTHVEGGRGGCIQVLLVVVVVTDAEEIIERRGSARTIPAHTLHHTE